MNRRFIPSLVALAAALTLAGLGHYYLLYLHVYVWDVVVFYVVAALLLAWAYRRAEDVPEHRWVLVQSALRRLRAALQSLHFRRSPSWLLIVILAAANGLTVLVVLLMPRPAGLLPALLLWAGGAVLAILVLWPRQARPRPAPVSDSAVIETREVRPGRYAISAGLRNALVLILSSLSIGCWLILHNWYSLSDHFTPHFAFDKIPGHFQSPILRYTTFIFFAISVVYFVNYLFIKKAPEISRTIKLAIVLLVVGGGIVNILLYPVGALDVFNYLIEIKLAYFYGQNPYLETFRRFADDPFASHAFFLDTPLGYPPGWLLLSAVPAALGGLSDLLSALLTYKVFTFALVILAGLIVYKYQDDERSGWLAAYIFLANPLVLFETAANAHNDAMMTVFLIAAVLALKRKSVLAAPLLTLSTSIKVFCAPLMLFFALVMLMDRWSWWKIVLSALFSVVVAVAVFAPFWAGGEMLGKFWDSAQFYGKMSSASIFSLVREYLMYRHVSEDIVSQVWYVFGGLFAVSAIVVMWRQRRDVERAMANVLLLSFVLLTVFFPWYLVPVIAILALKRDKLGYAYLFLTSALGLIRYTLLVWAWFDSGFSPLRGHQFEGVFLTLPLLVFFVVQILVSGYKRAKQSGLKAMRQFFTLMPVVAALALAGLGHYYLLYRRVHVCSAVAFYALAALLMAWAYGWAEAVPKRAWDLGLAAWWQLRAALGELPSRGPSRLLVGALAAVNGLSALIALLVLPPAGLLLAGLLWAGGVAALAALIPWPRWTVSEPAPALAPIPALGGMTIDRTLIRLRLTREEAAKRACAVSGRLLGVGLVAALLGQVCFFYWRDHVEIGAFFWCVSILSFGVLLWIETPFREASASGEATEAQAAPSLWAEGGHRRWLRVVAGVGGAGAATLAGLLARSRARLGAADFSDLLWLWLIGVTWFLLAFVPPFSLKELWSRLIGRLRRHRVELVGLSALLLVALIVRAFDLEHIPVNLSGDEGIQGVEGLELLQPPMGNPFSTSIRFFAVPTMSFLAYAAAMQVFGETVAGLRMLSVLIGVATVLTTFLLAQELWGRRVAWMAAVVLAFSHYHLHFSRLGSNQIADGFFMTLALWLLVRGMRFRRVSCFALAGAVIGLGWYSYYGARLVGIVVAIYLAWPLVTERHFVARYGRSLLLLLGTALLVAAPLLLHFAEHPGEMVSRYRQMGIFPSGWLEREQEITGRSAVRLLLEQFWKSVSAFNYTLDPTFWYRPSIPLLDLLSGLLFVLGLLWATAHCRQAGNGLLLIWFWLSLFLGWVMTENPPSSMRMTGVAPALALLVGLGLNWLVGLSGRLLGSERRLWHAATVFVLVVIAGFNLRYYFVVYTPTRVYGNPTAEIGTHLARYLEEQDDSYVVYFHAPPVMYWDFGTLLFMARGVDGMDVAQDESARPDLNRGARFVFLPHRLSELEAVRVRFPGGVEKSVISPADERLLYTLYEVPLQE